MEIILNIINKMSYAMYIISIFFVNVFISVYILTDSLIYIGYTLLLLGLAILFGKLESSIMDMLLDKF